MKNAARIKVVRMKPSSAKVVASLFQQVVSGLGYYNLRARREELAKYTELELKKMRAEDEDSILVAMLGGRAVGFCFSRYDDGLIWLSWFGILKDCRGMGFGSALLEALQQTVRRRRCHKLWCDTRTSNLASQRLLKKFSFRRICKLENHWYSQDFYLWQKPIG